MSISRIHLIEIFGDSVQVRVLDRLCALLIKEGPDSKLQWMNLSQLASKSEVAKSSVKRVVDDLLLKKLVMEQKIQTHAQNPPRNIRLNDSNPVIGELLFFFCSGFWFSLPCSYKPHNSVIHY